MATAERENRQPFNQSMNRKTSLRLKFIDELKLVDLKHALRKSRTQN
jgi:hypothetical protein